MSAARSKASPQDSVLSCPICMDVFKTPRMLPCQHTLCEACLHSYIVNKSRERVLVSDFPCPVCRTSTPAPRAFTRIDTWASLFPLNHLLVSLLDTGLQELLDKSESYSEKCDEHPTKVIEFFCVDHGIKVCSKCFKNTHRQCNIVDIEEHTEFTTRFSTVKSDIENILTYLVETITHLKSNIDQLMTQKNAILTEVQEFRDKVEALLNAFEADIRDKIDAHHDGETKMIKAQCEKYENMKEEIDSMAAALASLAGSGDILKSLENVLSIENEIKSHVSFLSGCHSNIKQVKMEFAIEMQLLSFLNSFSHLGKVTTSRFEPSLKKPPELLSRVNLKYDQSLQSSRDQTSNSESEPSPVNANHHSPRSRPLNLVCRAVAQTLPKAKSPPPNSKEPKRPLTVPIESTTSNPIIRPRPERPEVRAVTLFRPRSFSSPVNDPLSTGASNEEVGEVFVPVSSSDSIPSDASNATSVLREPIREQSTAANEDQGTSSIQLSGNMCTAEISGGNCQRRAWQYVNIASGMNNANDRKGSVDSQREESNKEARAVRAELTSARTVITSDGAEGRPSVKSDSVSAIRETHNAQVPNDVANAQPLYENTSEILPKTSTPVRTQDTKQDTSSTANARITSTSHLSTAPTGLPNQLSGYCTKMGDICIRLQGDSHECTITDSIEMKDNKIVLVDCNNNRIKLLNSDFTHKSHLDMSKEPWNATLMSNNEIAVTVPLEKAIHIIRVGESGMDTLRCVGTRRECWGICYANGKFIITTKDDGNLIIFLDSTGREIQIVNFASRENPNILRPVSISLSSTDHTLYLSCEGQTGSKGSVVRMSSRGDILYVYTSKQLDRPYSSIIDATDNVYVSGIRSANVVMFTEGGAKVTTLLSRDMGLCRPQNIQILNRGGKTLLLLSERRLDTVWLYELK